MNLIVLLIPLLLQAAQPCLAFARPPSYLCPASISSSTQRSPLRAVAKVEKTDEEWRQVLSPEAYRVLREEGTEPPNTSPLNDVKEDGVFRCAGCGSPLFVTKTKYESGSGWPSFYAPIDGDAVELDVDFKLIAPRTEVHCKTCGGHLGHVFDDGPRPTGKRYCMNGVAMDFVSVGSDLELTKEVMDRADAAEGDITKQVQEPMMAVLPSAAFDAVVAALFFNSLFVGQPSDGQLLGIVFQLIPLLGGAYFFASFMQKMAGLAGLKD